MNKVSLLNLPVKRIKTQNYTPSIIDVEFVVIHYTAGSLDRVVDLFTDPLKKVSAHLIIDLNGDVIEVVPCLDGEAYRAWHSGDSFWFDGERDWNNFNDFSIGIEIVNMNGNILEYTSQQYSSLEIIIAKLKNNFPKLNSAERIVGHEHIAGWRGKSDPGYKFDWKLFYEKCYPGSRHPERISIVPAELREALEKFIPFKPEKEKDMVKFWHALSFNTEIAVKLMHKYK